MDLDRHIERVVTDRWARAAALASAVRSGAEAGRVGEALARTASGAEAIERARLARAAELVGERFEEAARAWARVAGAAPGVSLRAGVAEAVGAGVPLPEAPARARLGPGQMVIATAPVRIDLAGGWSDTPPICQELGGAVVNVATTLAGRQPVQAVAQVCDERVIRITSIDLGRSVELTTAGEVLAHDDPADWAALPKAALVLSGLAPGHPDSDLASWLEGVGGGVRLTVFAAVPKGSGLGTSSILGATLLAALARLTGEEASVAQLCRRASMLEQRMGTGGGWQDQLGGMTPGFKLLRTRPGTDQSPRVEPVVPPPAAAEELAARTVLYYTGFQRLAANILQQVVGRYLAREPEALEAVSGLKSGAERLAAALGVGDVDGVASCLLEYWRLKCRLDPGSTTPGVEALLDPLRDDLAGYGLAGAGGGGFLCLIARDRDAAARVRRALARAHPSRAARLFDAAADERGLLVSVV